MSNLPIKKFFDELSSHWDEGNDERSDLREALIRRLPIKKGMHILDAGCGTGVITPLLYELSGTRVIGIDISTKMIEIAKEKDKEGNNDFIAADLYEHQFDPGFDGVVFYNCYPHFMDAEALNQKLNEILNDKGFFAIVHNSGRGELFACHRRHMHVSKNILPVLKEAALYSNNFEVETAEESDDFYLLVMRKK